MQQVFAVSERRACRVVRMHRITYQYQPRRDQQAFLTMRIKEIAATRIRYGYKRIHVLLQREGWQINHKRVYRLYRLEGLNLRGKSRRKTISQARVPNVDKLKARLSFRNRAFVDRFLCVFHKS